MAGDWIKVETATSRKSEVLRMAEMLGVDRRQCMGILVDYWSWLDANARTDCVPNLSRKSLDDVLNCAGLAACLEAVGWAKWDASGWQMTVINHDHHNGQSAKTRAYEQKRKKNQRANVSRICPTETGTREEKRRVTTTSLRSVVEQRPPLDEPTDEHRAIATERGVSCQAEFEKYRDWLAATGKRHRDPAAGFRNWLRRAGEYRRPVSQSVHDKRAATAAAMFGPRKETNAEPTDITAEAKRVA